MQTGGLLPARAGNLALLTRAPEPDTERSYVGRAALPVHIHDLFIANLAPFPSIEDFGGFPASASSLHTCSGVNFSAP